MEDSRDTFMTRPFPRSAGDDRRVRLDKEDSSSKIQDTAVWGEWRVDEGYKMDGLPAGVLSFYSLGSFLLRRVWVPPETGQEGAAVDFENFRRLRRERPLPL